MLDCGGFKGEVLKYMKDSEFRVCGPDSTSGHLGTVNGRVIMRTYRGHKETKQVARLTNSATPSARDQVPNSPKWEEVKMARNSNTVQYIVL